MFFFCRVFVRRATDLFKDRVIVVTHRILPRDPLEFTLQAFFLALELLPLGPDKIRCPFRR